MFEEVFLGDGLYASYDGWQVKLRTPREEGDHEIFLEPAVMIALRRYMQEILDMRSSQSN